ncbi:UDP-N-acetylmuramoyl-L-alanine--D-glutamate ligase [Proteus hauseri]|uniref:UDP-N-acetylmuramoyl-L-alanine--D-glutamate ligase n=1 Tax=Proteus hauseri TaxID=183417 RepID=UPI0032DA54B5
MANYQGKKIVIVGLGITGLSCVDFFIRQGVTPKVIDTRKHPGGLDKLPSTVEYYTGGFHQAWLNDADLIVSSPGVALSTPELAQAASLGVEIVGDIELFCREAKAPIVAITGSNGKSTVTTLVGEMASADGIRVGVGGNIGVPALTLLTQPYDLYVLELSSFQLETTYSLKAAAATVLNISEDHMNRYPLGLAQYREVKLRIYKHAKVCVYNEDDTLTLPLAGKDARCVSFGVGQGDYQLDNTNRMLKVQGEKLLSTAQMYLSGQHNYTNALAALALTDAVGISRQAATEVLKTYHGLAHRFQLVYSHQGVRWINDSKATNVGSTEAALRGLEVDGTLHLLLGGDGKSADFTALLPYISGSNVRLYCFGQDGQALANLRPDVSLLTVTMEEAMRALAPTVKSGDMVLLSPACASLDQFRSFEQRGDDFARLARELG